MTTALGVDGSLTAERRRLLKLITAAIGALAVAIGLSGAGSWIKELLYGDKAVEIASSSVKYKARDGAEISARLCRPNGRGPFSAVIVIHEVFGLVDHIKDVACRFARGLRGNSPRPLLEGGWARGDARRSRHNEGHRGPA